VPPVRISWPLIAFLAYVAAMLMVSRPWQLLPPGIGGKVQLSDLLFPLAMASWLPGAVGSCWRWLGSRILERPGTFRHLDSAQSEPFSIAAEMGLVGLAAWATFWVLSLRFMWASTPQGFPGIRARYHAIGCGATLLTSINLDVMRFRFLWIALAPGIAAAVCARPEAPA
jgi:hypothetical protein